MNKHILAILILALSISGVSAGVMFRVIKTYEGVVRTQTTQTIYIQDSNFMQHRLDIEWDGRRDWIGQKQLDWADAKPDTVETIRIVKLDSGLVYEIKPRKKQRSVISLGEFLKNYKKQIKNALNRNKKNAELETRLLRRKPLSRDIMILKKHGRFSERFDWTVDTLMFAQDSTDGAPTTFLEIRRSGVVKFEPRDTLTITRSLRTVAQSEALEAVNQFMTRVLDKYKEQSFVNELFMTYYFPPDKGTNSDGWPAQLAR